MKIQYKIIYSLLGLAILFADVSCKKGFEELNAPYKDATVSTATPAGFFNNLARRATDDAYTLHTTLIMPKLNQQGVQNIVSLPYVNYITTYWQAYYQDLADYKQLLKLIDATSTPAAYTDVKSMATILIASKTLSMLDRYGSIPYSSAGIATDGIEKYRPTYDDEKSIYMSILADLATAVNSIGGAGQINIGNYESFLANDFDAWRKFGNALRLRYAVRLSAKAEMQALVTGIIQDVVTGNKPLPNNQNLTALQKSNFGNYPLIVVPQTDYNLRYWYSFREASVGNMRMSTNVWNQMSSTNADDGSGIFDPRCKIWFMPNNAGKWVPQPQNSAGSAPGSTGTAYPNQETPSAPNLPNGNVYAPFNFYMVRDFASFPYLIITEADVHFLKAEIYNRGLGGVAANPTMAKSEYDAGLKASVDFWYGYVNNGTTSFWPSTGVGGKPGALSTTDWNNFINTPAVMYNVADPATTNYQKIVKQAWLATIWQPLEAWAIVRRTGITPKDPAYSSPDVVNKLPYPNDEENNNNDNWKAAAGGADQTQQAAKKVYWMP